MLTVNIFYAQFTQAFTAAKWQFYWRQLPELLQQKIIRYHRWQDQHTGLLSYLLLKKVLINQGYTEDCLTQLQKETHGRPFIDRSIDFNISHSSQYVVCAIGAGIRLGIDIEEIRMIEVTDFKNYMTQAQWLDISQPAISYAKFFDYWTIKESVMKADGRGLLIPLVDIHTQGDQAIVYEKTWFLKSIPIATTYACHLATDQAQYQITINSVSF